MTYFKATILAIVCSVASLSSPTSMVTAFSMPMFTEQKTMQRTTPSKTDGVEIEIPNFDELFGRIKEVSPLAALANHHTQGRGGEAGAGGRARVGKRPEFAPGGRDLPA